MRDLRNTIFVKVNSRFGYWDLCKIDIYAQSEREMHRLFWIINWINTMSPIASFLQSEFVSALKIPVFLEMQ